jgi:hypothetical protein
MGNLGALVDAGECISGLANVAATGREPLALRSRIRSVNAISKSLMCGRRVLPRDLWAIKAAVAGVCERGDDEAAVERLWGERPFRTLSTAEGGVMGMQSWERRGLVFNPYADFFEFLPVDNRARPTSTGGWDYRTVLINEVQAGNDYELVITSFHGMPFVRYQTGIVVRFIAAEGVRPLTFEIVSQGGHARAAYPLAA